MIPAEHTPEPRHCDPFDDRKDEYAARKDTIIIPEPPKHLAEVES